MIESMKATLLKQGLLLLAAGALAGCVSYAQIDLGSAGSSTTRGSYANVGTVVDAETKVAMKASSNDETGRLAVRAAHPLLANFDCGERIKGVSYTLATKSYKLNLEKDAHLSYAPQIDDESGTRTCRILINIVGADGRYIQHDFDTERVNTDSGDLVYRFKAVGVKAEAPPPSNTEEPAKPR
jgi:hypothetical protein